MIIDFYGRNSGGGGGGSLPPQTGNSGKFLTTNGTNTSWAEIPSNAFWCEFTVTNSGDTQLVSCNKTLTEIGNAYNSGQVAFGKLTGDAMPLILQNVLTVVESGLVNTVFTLQEGGSILVVQGNNYGGADTWQIEEDSMTLDVLSDVTIESAVTGDVLKYDGTSGKWVNGQVSAGGDEQTELAIAAAINDTRDTINQDLHNNYATKKMVNDNLMNYLTKGVIDNYYTKSQVDTQIGNVNANIDAVSGNINTDIGDKEEVVSYAINDINDKLKSTVALTFTFSDQTTATYNVYGTLQS